MHPPPPSHPLSAGDDQPTTRTAVEAQCGSYRLSEVIGHSSRALVYLAARAQERSARRPTPCALKRAAGEGTAPPAPEDMQTLVREIELMRRFDHVGIVRTLDHHNGAGGEPYLVMELLDGLPLDRLMRRLGRMGDVMPSALSAFVVHEIATALGYAHGLCDGSGSPLEVVHGQLRPKDVMLVRTGEVKLLAFGPGQQAALPRVPVSPRAIRRHACYRAPEQIMGRPIDQRADLFALGALFWELLVGPPLFSGVTEHEAVAAVLNNEVPPPSSLRQGIPARLDAIVMRALARDPRRRYPSAEALALDLARGLPSRHKLTRYTATLVTNQLGPSRHKEVPMSTTSESRTPRPMPPRPPTTPSAPPGRRPSVPPPLPLPARQATPPHNRRTTLPMPGSQPLTPHAPLPMSARPALPAAVMAKRAYRPTPDMLAEYTLATPTPIVAPLMPAPTPLARRAPLPTPHATPQTYRPTPSGVTSFLMTTPTPTMRPLTLTPTPTMRPLPPAALPARPANRPPLLSRTERIERICLQWLSVGAVGFVCGVLWHEQHMTGDAAGFASGNQPRPEIVAIDNPGGAPNDPRSPAAQAPAPLAPTPTIVEARIPRAPVRKTGAAHRALSRASLRAAVRRTQTIR